MKAKFFLNALVFVFSTALFMSSCSEAENENQIEEDNNLTNFKIHITDAPVDDISVEAVFVSFSEVVIDGESYPLENTKTVEVSTLVDGKSELIFDQDIKASAKSNIELVLNLNDDAQGNSPGCYVLTKDGIKHNLATENLTVLNIDLDATQSENESMLFDLDLRKAIVYNKEDSSDKFDFNSDLNSSVRVVSNNNIKLEGKLVDELNIADDKVIIYAYTKGGFQKETEINMTASTDVMFKNAVGSAMVSDEGYFSLNHLTPGHYELKIVSYTESPSGELRANAFLNPGLTAALDFFNLSLDTNTQMNLTVALKVMI